jgi:excisionase family DNA binding protein
MTDHSAARTPRLDLRPLMTVREVARLLQLHEKTVRRLVRHGRIPCLRLGRTVRFQPDVVLRWLAAKEQ